MRRREFIALLGGAVAAWPLTAQAQERMRRIGVIMAYGERDPEGHARFSALREQLHKLGWAEGSNIRIEARWAAGKPDLMQAYASELVELPADVLVGNSIALLAILRRLTRTIPIVFTQVADPIASGFVSNYARPDGNMTGFTGFDVSIAGKWMEVLKEVAPFVNRATILVNPEQANYLAFLQAVESRRLRSGCRFPWPRHAIGPRSSKQSPLWPGKWIADWSFCLVLSTTHCAIQSSNWPPNIACQRFTRSGTTPVTEDCFITE